jgi:hypothetical protein
MTAVKDIQKILQPTIVTIEGIQKTLLDLPKMRTDLNGIRARLDKLERSVNGIANGMIVVKIQSAKVCDLGSISLIISLKFQQALNRQARDGLLCPYVEVVSPTGSSLVEVKLFRISILNL